MQHTIQPIGGNYRVYCGNEDCMVEPKTHWLSRKEDAVRTWNRRADDE